MSESKTPEEYNMKNSLWESMRVLASEISDLETELIQAQQTIAQKDGEIRQLREVLGNIETWSSCAMTAPETQAALDGFEQIKDEATKALSTPAPVAVVPWEVAIHYMKSKESYETAIINGYDLSDCRERRLIFEEAEKQFQSYAPTKGNL